MVLIRSGIARLRGCGICAALCLSVIQVRMLRNCMPLYAVLCGTSGLPQTHEFAFRSDDLKPGLSLGLGLGLRFRA